jgi:hypothetical protein
MKLKDILKENYSNQANRQAAAALDVVTELDAESMQVFFEALSKYFTDNKESLSNMDAGKIGQSLKTCAKLVKVRTGN